MDLNSFGFQRASRELPSSPRPDCSRVDSPASDLDALNGRVGRKMEYQNVVLPKNNVCVCVSGKKVTFYSSCSFSKPTYVLLVHVVDRLQDLFDKCTCIFFGVAAFLDDPVE